MVRRKISESVRERFFEWGLLSLFAGAMFLGVRGCNYCFNNFQTKEESHQTVSYSTGITGHVEYTRYKDGSQDVKVYPGVGHRLWDSDLFQDLNGDGKVDRIRRNGPEWKVNSLTEVLVRKQDYETNRERFDKADARLRELRAEYAEKN